MTWRRWRPGRPGRAPPEPSSALPADPPATDPPDEAAWAILRGRMVRQQIAARGLDDPELLRAFSTVPRHRFVQSSDPYGDRALGIGSGQTISQPYVVAAMTWLGRPAGGWRDARVLEVGTGSGYGAAILAELGAQVVTIERLPALAAEALERLRETGHDGVRVVVGDGSLGFGEAAPYDAILVTAAGPDVPGPLVHQLSTDGGRLVMPVGSADQQWLTLVERHGEQVSRRTVEPVVFVPLVGEHGVR